MIFELREYAVVPGRVPDMVALSGEVSRRIRGDDYGKLEGYWTSEIGPLNRLVHLWTFPSFDERARLRAALAGNRAWKEEFLARFMPNLQWQRNTFLVPQLPFKPPAERGHVYELRRYRAQTGTIMEWVGHFKAVMPVRERYSANVGCWTTESGTVGEVVHLWAYRDLNHRAQVRGAAMQDPEWKRFLGVGNPLLAEMESVVLLPVPFSPMG